MLVIHFFSFFFFNDPAPPEISPLPLHDALPICPLQRPRGAAPQGLRRLHGGRVRRGPPADGRPPAGRRPPPQPASRAGAEPAAPPDRKSTRLNSSHDQISYAVFCLKKKKKNKRT